jgi:hypothetical protein
MGTILISSHHRRSLFFEKGIKLLVDKYPLILQNTENSDHGFGEFGLHHPNITIHKNNKQMSYDESMVQFKSILKDYSFDNLVFLDNDIFFTNTKYFEAQLKEFVDDNYDYCCHFIGPYERMMNEIDFGQYGMRQVKEVKFTPWEYYPYFAPAPHWENAFMFISKRLWDALTPDEVSHGRKFIRATFEKGFKMGTRKCNYRGTYTHFGDGWFHVGALMSYYYRLEILNPDGLDVKSSTDMARIGYFIVQRNIFGKDIYSERINSNLNVICLLLGGENIPLNAWNEHIKGTCMERM